MYSDIVSQLVLDYIAQERKKTWLTMSLLNTQIGQDSINEHLLIRRVEKSKKKLFLSRHWMPTSVCTCRIVLSFGAGILNIICNSFSCQLLAIVLYISFPVTFGRVLLIHFLNSHFQPATYQYGAAIMVEPLWCVQFGVGILWCWFLWRATIWCNGAKNFFALWNFWWPL